MILGCLLRKGRGTGLETGDVGCAVAKLNLKPSSVPVLQASCGELYLTYSPVDNGLLIIVLQHGVEPKARNGEPLTSLRGY